MKLSFKEGFKSVIYPCSAMIKFDGTFQVIRNGNTGISKRGVKRHLPFLYTPSDKVFYGELIRGEGKNRYEEFASGSKEQYKVVLLDREGAEPYEDRIAEFEKYKNEWTIVPEIFYAQDRKQLEDFFDSVVELGYEGIVAKCNGYRVKIKADYTTDLVVKGVSKVKSACLLGSFTENYCNASILGKTSLQEAIRGVKIIGGTPEHHLIEPRIVVEIRHWGVIRNGKIAFRNPDILRVRFDKSAQEVKSVKL